MKKVKAEIGVFGGTGFYSFLEDIKEVSIKTPYGDPSDVIAIGNINGRRVAFLPRHGRNHQYPPHMVNYRANVYAMKELGIKRIFGPCAAGSLSLDVKPGDFVICNQYIDRTSGRKSTFYDGPKTTHVSGSDPYCPEMRKKVIETAKELNLPVHENGTVIVIQGPRFSTRAESKWFSSLGWEVINMTQFPECHLARELEICYVNISLITDYDVGLEGHPKIKPVSHEEVIRVFKENNEKLKELIFKCIPKIPEKRNCICSKALEGASF